MIADYIHSQGFAASTEKQYERVLMKLESEVEDLEKLTPKELRDWLLKTGWGESAMWMAHCAVKGYLRWRYGEAHPALKLRLKRVGAGPQRSLKLAQIQQLLESFDTSKPHGRRDLAICTLALDTGLRSAEICSLEVKRIDLEERSCYVKVKGGRWDKAVFSEYTSVCIATWMADRERNAKPGVKTLFVGIGGKCPGEHMTNGGLRAIMRRWAKQAGLSALSPHDLRRTMATVATRLGAPSRVVQVAGRWKTLAMVEHYTEGIEAEDMEPWSPVGAAMTRKL